MPTNTPPSEAAPVATLADLPGYLRRLGFGRAPPPTLETLRELQRRHTETFAFETLSTFLRLPVPVDLASIERKLLREGRGGYCYELNRLYLALLQALGFDARALTARVVMGRPEDALTARTHLLVLVTLPDGVRYTSDVGFGGMVPTAPLRLDNEEAQPTPHEAYRLAPHGDGFILRAQVAGEWRAMYVFDLQPPAEIDLIVGNWYVSTHPDSPFLGQLVAARTGPGLRRTLRDASYAVHRSGVPSERVELAGPQAVIDCLEREFGLRMPAHPQLHERLAAMGAAG